MGQSMLVEVEEARPVHHPLQRAQTQAFGSPYLAEQKHGRWLRPLAGTSLDGPVPGTAPSPQCQDLHSVALVRRFLYGNYVESHELRIVASELLENGRGSVLNLFFHERSVRC